AMPLAETPAKLAGARPAAVVVAEPQADPALVADLVRRVEELEGPFVPVLAHLPEDLNRPSSVLPIAADAEPRRVVARLTAALRIRALHATVQRRAAAAAAQ